MEISKRILDKQNVAVGYIQEVSKLNGSGYDRKHGNFWIPLVFSLVS